MGQNIILKIFSRSLIGLLVVALRFIHTTALAPNIDDLLRVQCSSDKPYLCIPYGSCCSGSEFCYQGNCESCFPQDLAESELLSWCRYKGQNNVSLMRHTSCGMACQLKFRASSLELCEDPIDACGCPSERPKKCSLGQCCRYDQYCNGQDCTSCFPENVTESELNDLCRNSSYFLSMDSCRFACLEISFSSQHSKNQDLNGWMFAFIAISIVCAALVTMSIYLYVKPCMKREKPKTTKTEDEDVELMHGNTQTLHPPVRLKTQRSISSEEHQNTALRTTDTPLAVDEISERDNIMIDVHNRIS